MTVPNRTWWIVLTPAAGELFGVLVTQDGVAAYTLIGATEEPLVRDLAAHADPTVDVSVAHGWDQAPKELRAVYESTRARRW